VALLIVVLTWQIKVRGVKLYPQDRTDGFPCLWRRLTISVPRMICHRCGIAVDFDAMGGTKQCEGLQSTTAGKGKASHGAGKWRLSRPTPDMLYEAEKQLQRARKNTLSSRAPHSNNLQSTRRHCMRRTTRPPAHHCAARFMQNTCVWRAVRCVFAGV